MFPFVPHLAKFPIYFLRLLREQRCLKEPESEWTRRMKWGRATQRENKKRSFSIISRGFEQKNTPTPPHNLAGRCQNTKTKRKHRDGHTLLEISSCWCCIISKIKRTISICPMVTLPSLPVETCRSQSSIIHIWARRRLHFSLSFCCSACQSGLSSTSGSRSVKDHIDHLLNVAYTWGARVTRSRKWIIDPRMRSDRVSKW